MMGGTTMIRNYNFYNFASCNSVSLFASLHPVLPHSWPLPTPASWSFFICILFRLYRAWWTWHLSSSPQPCRCVRVLGKPSQMLTNSWQQDRREKGNFGWQLQIWLLTHLESSVVSLKLWDRGWSCWSFFVFPIDAYYLDSLFLVGCTFLSCDCSVKATDWSGPKSAKTC